VGVELSVPRGPVRPGVGLSPAVRLQGGLVDRRIRRVGLSVRATDDGGETAHVLARAAVDGDFALAADAERTVHAGLALPRSTPVTRGGVAVRVVATVDAGWGHAPTAAAGLTVRPDEYVAALLEAVSRLEFAPDGATLVETPYLDDRPVVQRLAFRPTGGRETPAGLSLTLLPRADSLRVVAGIEGHDTAFDAQEIPMTFEHADASGLARRLAATIDRHG
jgi:sporulation-control protein spo0M